MLTSNELLAIADELERDGLANGDPFDGHDWSVVQLARAFREAERDAQRYRWLRSEGIDRINFGGLTPDTCDVGLDSAIDDEIEQQRFQEHLNRATEIVGQWPAWKQSALG